MRMHLILLVIWLFAVLTGCRGVYEFEVTVVSEDNTPIVGAGVYILGKEESTSYIPATYTDQFGAATLRKTEGSSMISRLVVIKEGYLPVVEREQKFKPGTTEFKVVLKMKSGEHCEKGDPTNELEENPMNNVDSGD